MLQVEDCIRTGKDCGIDRFPSHGFAMNSATWLSWLRPIALDGDLARAEPKTLRYRVLPPPQSWSAAAAADG